MSQYCLIRTGNISQIVHFSIHWPVYTVLPSGQYFKNKALLFLAVSVQGEGEPPIIITPFYRLKKPPNITEESSALFWLRNQKKIVKMKA